MKNYQLKAALAAKEVKNAKALSAKRIVLGIDVHLKSYYVARKVDNAAVGTVAKLGTQEECVFYVERQLQQAEQVVAVYEAGPLGYVLYRALKARGVDCKVCAPDSTLQKQTRRKTNQIDARTLVSNLSNYLNGNERALRLARVPTEEQERERLRSRALDGLVEERKRLAAKGNSLMLSQGYGSYKGWWRAKSFERLSPGLADWLVELLKVWVALLRQLDEQIAKAKAQLSQRAQGARPKGAGAQSMVQLQAELLDWDLYSSKRKIGCLSGMVPSEWSTGTGQRLGSITKVGVPAIRRNIVEMVWRFKRFQPNYRPIQKWKELLEGTNRSLKKKAVVAIGRHLIVDLWRLQTGRATAQQLKLSMIGG
ncbi:MAG TPA: transposase [Chthoniobacterales bacterium]|nr:transposase [Chthoniobacterales bacterium]